MKILCVCRQGENRSRYLAEYLKTQGYDAQYGGSSRVGVNPVTAKQVDWADIIITIRDPIKEEFLQVFPTKKRIIALNVYDNPSMFGEEAVRFKFEHPREYQEKYVYSKLREQIAPYLPLK